MEREKKDALKSEGQDVTGKWVFILILTLTPVVILSQFSNAILKKNQHILLSDPLRLQSTPLPSLNLILPGPHVLPLAPTLARDPAF